MNLSELLQVLQEVNKLVAALEAMGLKITGTINLPEILGLLGMKLGS